ncbi:ABC transporter ATP-binding protein [Streptacidiphilus sp. P02-A3a]|uniref:ABC transporter ATP-binding protein n=1 Tax=Streptacidiphilus sp. P02-A3a TaxID=2704468 RepID=UPI0015FC17A2|nr:ABC transporter ATP-binding protein [Streptacidiphilus sp. P02-A3a]QMU70092.1 ABC transporter ATP-binding protein [Streptacidiphilus sp. P02-A3a]QMU70455.1 ABC transporter ATP-binding protein [Streptacidiphilus sp. P02-A3a]
MTTPAPAAPDPAAPDPAVPDPAVPDPAVPVLAVERLTVTHRHRDGHTTAVDQVCFALPPGDALVLLGASGSGKTTVARAVLGLPARNAETTGRIELRGTDLRALDERALSRVRGRRIGYVPQDPTGSLDPLRRVGAQLAEVLRRHQRATGRRAARAAVPDLLESVGIDDPRRVADSFPHQLSGGQRQRAAIALAVCCEPELLIADEPTTALDALVRAQVLDLFARLRAERGIALLLVTHDLAVARRTGGQVAVMRAGRIVESGPAARVLTHPAHRFTAELVGAHPGADQ